MAFTLGSPALFPRLNISVTRDEAIAVLVALRRTGFLLSNYTMVATSLLLAFYSVYLIVARGAFLASHSPLVLMCICTEGECAQLRG